VEYFDEVAVGHGVKGLLNVQKIAAIFEWLTSMFCQVSVTFRRASWVDDWGRKPNWMLLRSLCFDRNFEM